MWLLQTSLMKANLFLRKIDLKVAAGMSFSAVKNLNLGAAQLHDFFVGHCLGWHDCFGPIRRSLAACRSRTPFEMDLQ